MEKSEQTNFTFTLDGFKLPDDVIHKISSEIREVVMRNLGELDPSKVTPGYGRIDPPRDGSHAPLYVDAHTPVHIVLSKWNGGILKNIRKELLANADIAKALGMQTTLEKHG